MTFSGFQLFASACMFSATALIASPTSAKKDLAQEAIEEESTEVANNEASVSAISESFGHLIGKNLESLGFEFEMEKVVKGLQDSVHGKDAPMNETECVQAISTLQEKNFQKLADENLQRADEFMKENCAQNDVKEIEPGKLQYTVQREGNGEVVQPHFSPLIRYSGKFIDGKVFGASSEDEMISLDETIPGFTKGIVGMKEGEKRTLYIHPTMGYGTQGYLPPNSLLTFDIEVVKANAPKEEHEAAGKASDNYEEDSAEIAEPDENATSDEILR